MDKTRIVIICGPTAAGKSAIAAELASKFNAEIVSADSMQVYRQMDIGTAKPDASLRSVAVHHLIDIIDPDQDYSAALYMKDAIAAIEDIRSKGRNVIVAGGTGLYIKALTKGLFDAPPSDKAVRQRLQDEAEKTGLAGLYERLKEADPESAAAIHPNNRARIIRALEIYATTGIAASKLRKEHGFAQVRFKSLKIGITRERDELYRAIDERVDAMMKDGLLQETERLISMGYPCTLKSMRALGYKEICSFINGEYSLEEAVELIKKETRRYAKRQMTWFRADAEINWFYPGDKSDIIRAVENHLC
ncbi:MAG: tRNA (adenosine(37)-N6)-dimethylallyltransferase MiaA [Deltaproteobacteria bacterium]